MSAASSIPDASEHARTRWVQRVGVGGVGVAAGWLEAVSLEGHGHGCHGDEARYHRESNTVMVRKDDTITTVMDGRALKESTRRAVERAAGVDPEEVRG